MTRKIIVCCFALMITMTMDAQIIADYSFDGCDLEDQLNNFEDATSNSSTLSCDCGLITDGFYLDGNDDNIVFPDSLKSFLSEDFTISFYFRFDEVMDRTDIFSLRSNCTSLDSFMAVTYRPNTNAIRFELAQDIADIQSIDTQLDTTQCWHRIVITKAELRYNLYLDDQLGASILSTAGVVQFGTDANLAVALSPCIAVNENRFNGWIDEFKFYNRALSAGEIVSNSLNPDQIITNDTTIVGGSDVQLNVGATCAQSFLWSPTTDLDDPSILDPIASPEMSTTYEVSIVNSGGCMTQDTVRINVIDPNSIDCSEVLLPNAFTPNNDLLNDRYGISSRFLIEDLEYFQIYDRWGAKMWETNSKDGEWDATFKGNAVNPGMYIYKLKYTCGGSEYVKVDNFSVLR